MTNPEITNFDLTSNENWRERFLRIVLITACIVSPIILVSALPMVTGKLSIATSHVVAYLFLLAFTFLPIPYTIRATGMLFIIYAIGLITLLGWGPFSDGSLFFLTSIVLACLFFDYKAGIVVNVLNTVTILVTGWFMVNGFSATLTGSFPVQDWYAWINYAVDLLTVGGVLTLGLFIFKTDFDQANERVRQVVTTILEERNTLENRIRERTYGLEKKTDYLRSISLISRKIASIQDINSLLNTAAQLIAEEFGFYHVAIFSINTNGDQIILEAASSEGGKKLLEQGYRVDTYAKYPITIALKERVPHISLDVGDDAESFRISELPNTRSELAIPMIIRDKVIGILDLHSTEAKAFIKDDLDVFTSLSDHIAAAIDNVNLLNETQTILRQLEAVTNENTEENWKRRLERREHAYTYTPLGLRPEKSIEGDEDAVTIPISLRGYKIGAITMSRKNKPWDAEEKELAGKIAGQVSLAADNLRLVEEAQANALRDQTISTVSGKMRESLDMEAVLLNAVNEFQRAMNLKEVEIRLGLENSPRRKDTARSRFTGSLNLKDKRPGRG